MADELTDKKITQDQADRMMAPLELDLMAFFKIMEADMMDLADGYEGTPDEFINDIITMLSPGGGRVEKSLQTCKSEMSMMATRALKSLGKKGLRK